MMPMLVALPLMTVAAAVPAVPRFAVHEVVLHHSGQPAEPYQAIVAQAWLTGPEGERAQPLPLFWDGGDTWRLRVAPDQLGSWSWRVEANNPGLDGASGQFTCVASDRRGAIVPMPGHPEHFAWQDGSPCYWLGDTAWALFCDLPEEEHDRTAALRHIATRAEQGYNVITAMLVAELDRGNSGGKPFDGAVGERPNPGFWQEVDHRLQAAAEHGMVVGLVLAWTAKGRSRQSWQNFANREARLRYARYVAGRYAAYPVYFVVAGEWNLSGDDAAARAEYEAVGQELARVNLHRRLLAVHAARQKGRPLRHLRPFGDSPWHSFGDYQQCYTAVHEAVLFARGHGGPVVNAEYAYYRREAPDGSPDKPNSTDAAQIRAVSWDIAMAGGYLITGFGTTYFGGHRCRGPFDLDAAKNNDWEEQIQHLRGFFTAREWWRLSPHDALVVGAEQRSEDEVDAGHTGATRPSTRTWWCLAEPSREYLVYVRGNTSELRLTTAGAASWRVRRFDPRQGDWVTLAEAAGGDSLSLAAPDPQDWVFEVTRATAPEANGSTRPGG